MNTLILQTKKFIVSPIQKTKDVLAWKNSSLRLFFESLKIEKNWSKRRFIAIEDLESESGKTRPEIVNELRSQLKIDFYREIPLVRQVVTESVNKGSSRLLEHGYAISLNNEREKVILTDNLCNLFGKDRKLAGIPVGLTSKCLYHNYLLKIENFKNFISANRKNREIWRNVLGLCILDAVVEGASDVYLGFPNRDSFQYVVKNKKYQGKLDERIFTKLVGLFKSGLSNEDIFKTVFPLGGGSCHLSETQSQKSVTIVIESSIDSSSSGETNKLEKNSTFNEIDLRTPERHILLIDDDERFVELLRRGVSGRGYKVSVAVSANDALMYHLNSESSIDLIVTDLHLPKMNGIELIDTIKNRRPALPIIVLTTENTSESYIKIIEVGGNVVMQKEDDPQILLAWIKKLLSPRTLGSLDKT